MLPFVIVAVVILWLLSRSDGGGGDGGISTTPTTTQGTIPETAIPVYSPPVFSPNPSFGSLDDVAQAIFQFEGGNPGNRNVVNNNPGNVRSDRNQSGKAGGYATFADIGDGWDALNGWINRHVSANPSWDFYDLFNYYLHGSTKAPTVDAQGNADSYAEYVADYVGVDPSTPVSSVIGG